MRYLREEYGALSFFVGGDNIISICPAMDEADYRDAIEHVEAEAGVELKVGVGIADNPHTAGMDAKHALEECRHHETIVEMSYPQEDIGITTD